MLPVMDPQEEPEGVAPPEAEMLDAGAALHQLLTAAVRLFPREISLTAASVMRTIERTGPRRVTELAVTEQITQPSMTAIVTTLVKLGLVERRPDPVDQRVVLVALTAAGTAHIRQRRTSGADSFARLIGKLPTAEAKAITAAASALRHLRELEEQQHQDTVGQATGDWALPGE
jgi:DNA-binding MarR family transcriptional regulator